MMKDLKTRRIFRHFVRRASIAVVTLLAFNGALVLAVGISAYLIKTFNKFENHIAIGAIAFFSMCLIYVAILAIRSIWNAAIQDVKIENKKIMSQIRGENT